MPPSQKQSCLIQRLGIHLSMRIMLAPMEGVVDHHVRALLSHIGGLDGCVTEFIRVTEQTLPYKIFFRFAPEIESHCLTPSGTPVKLQLLGGKPEPMAIKDRKSTRLNSSHVKIS